MKVNAPTNHISFSYGIFGVIEHPQYSICMARHGSGMEYTINDKQRFIVSKSNL